jgi:hypothetical protein
VEVVPAAFPLIPFNPDRQAPSGAAAKSASKALPTSSYTPSKTSPCYPGATLPRDALLYKIVFTADTSAAPKGATGVKCHITTDEAVQDKMNDADAGEPPLPCMHAKEPCVCAL